MPDRIEKVAVVGAGAIGGITAAFVSRAGWDVELVCKHERIVRACGARGLHISGVRGEHTIRVPAVRTLDELSGPKDVVLLATKATDLAEAAPALKPLLAPEGVVVSLQNGICEDALAAVLGRQQVVGCVTGWGATMHGPAELEMTSTGEFVVGELDRELRPRLEPIREMLGVVVPTRISRNIMGELYSKLIVNSCINSLGALSGLPLGKLLALRPAREIFLAIMREAMTVAAAMDLRVEPGGGGKLNFYEFLEDRGRLADLRRHLMIRVIGFKYRRIRSSSLQSLERGRPTEIEFLNGYICAQGREHGVPTPVNDEVVALIKQIEEGKRSVSPENLELPGLAQVVRETRSA